MMDIEFIFPPLSVEERYGNKPIGEVGGNLPPLGLMCLAAFLRERNFFVNIIDATALGLSVEGILDQIEKDMPYVIGLTGLTSMYYKYAHLAKEIKARFPDKLIVVGGHHATIMPIETLSDNPSIDILVYGEGEMTVLEILEQYKKLNYSLRDFLSNHELLRSITGIVYRENGQIKMNLNREPIADLDELPFPARDLVPFEKYMPLPNQYKRTPVAHMIAVRGCPFSCTFCSNNAVFGKKIRMRSPENVVKEIETVKEQYGVNEISFWDDILTINKKWMMKFCDLIIERKLNITWSCYARVNTVNLDLLKKMKKAGCWNIFYGYEAGVQELLDNIKKGITLEDIKNAHRWTKEAGIEIRASFMLALPGETPALAEKTVDFAIELDPDYVQFSLTTPYPGTELYETAKKYGKLDVDFSKYHGWNAVFVPYGYKSADELYEIEHRATRRFYMRPKFLLKSIAKIRSLEDIKRYMKGFRFLVGFLKK